MFRDFTGNIFQFFFRGIKVIFLGSTVETESILFFKIKKDMVDFLICNRVDLIEIRAWNIFFPTFHRGLVLRTTTAFNGWYRLSIQFNF